MLKSLLPLVLLFLALVVSSASAKYLNVPKSLKQKAVYYKRSKQLRIFSCGYNVLFNAANFEHHCGFDNDSHRYATFKSRVVPYVRGRGYSTKDASWNDMTEYLAYKRLTLQPFYHLKINKNRPGGIGFSMTRDTHRTYPETYIKRSNRQDGLLDGIKQYLATHDYAVVHFLLYVNGRSGEHGILATIYKNEYGRGLYIFDNLNDAIYESDQTTKFLKYLCKKFKISDKDSYEGPRLPTLWPHLD